MNKPKSKGHQELRVSLKRQELVVVFVMALDQPKAQIEMLQEIAGILQDPAVIQSLMQANDFEEVRATLSNDRS